MPELVNKVPGLRVYGFGSYAAIPAGSLYICGTETQEVLQQQYPDLNARVNVELSPDRQIKLWVYTTAETEERVWSAVATSLGEVCERVFNPSGQ